jgi:YaiO family outer membrane protein
MQNRKLVLFIAGLFLTLYSFSQDSTTADGLFQIARKAAFDEKDYLKAIDYSKRALTISPSYTDIRIFLGRVYSWSKQYDSAKTTFDYVLAQQPQNEDASAAYTDLEYWNSHYDAALKIVDNGLQHHPNSEVLLLKKAKIFFALRRFTEASIIINKVLQLNKNNEEARALAERIKDASTKNKIGISYDYSHFDKQFPGPWHIISLDYTRYTGIGPLTFRANYANRFKRSGMQYEVDAYPHINKTFYAYLNLGYSADSSVFPKYRGGFSLYANLPKSFEAEAGIRYLKFSGATWIYTLYFGKYYKSFLFSSRVYLVPSNTNISQSYNVSARYYYKGVNDYLTLNLGTGISPDERASSILLGSGYKLRSNRASIIWQQSFKNLNILRLSAGWINQEYLPDTRGNQIDFGISYQRRF